MADGGSHSHGQALGQYGSQDLGQYGDNFASSSNLNGVRLGAGIEDLMHSIPGVPGQDYPVLAEVPETGFSCDGRVSGGKQFFCTVIIIEKTLVSLITHFKTGNLNKRAQSTKR